MSSASDLASLFLRMRDTVEFSDVELENVAQIGAFGNTPLHVAVSWGDSAAVRLLLDNGADINARGEYNMTPLHFAVGRNHPEIVALLVTSGADLLCKDTDGRTPFDWAKTSNRVEIMRLLERGNTE